MEQQLGEELEKIFMDKDCVIGIHRTGNTMINDIVLNNYFSNGIIMLDKSMQIGRANKSFDIENTVSIFNKFQYIISQIKACNNYKSSNGCMILKIPKSCIGLDNNKPLPLYQIKNNNCYIRPDFIYGYIPVDYKGNVSNIIYNPNYNNKNIINNDLVYDDKVTNNALEILFRNYQLTYNKYNKNQANTALIYFLKNNDVNYFTGENNRKLLKDRIYIYNCIKSIKYPNGITNKDLQLIIDQYESRIQEENSQGIIK